MPAAFVGNWSDGACFTIPRTQHVERKGEHRDIFIRSRDMEDLERPDFPLFCAFAKREVGVPGIQFDEEEFFRWCNEHCVELEDINIQELVGVIIPRRQILMG